MNPILTEVLGGLKSAVDSALSGATAAVPNLSAEGIQFLETAVAPKLDVPPAIVAALSTENATVEAPVDAFAEAELGLLKARIDSLFPTAAPASAAASAAAAAAAEPSKTPW